VGSCPVGSREHCRARGVPGRHDVSVLGTAAGRSPSRSGTATSQAACSPAAGRARPQRRTTAGIGSGIDLDRSRRLVAATEHPVRCGVGVKHRPTSTAPDRRFTLRLSSRSVTDYDPEPPPGGCGGQAAAFPGPGGLPGGTCDVSGDYIGCMAVQAAAGAVIPHRRPRIGVRGGFLHVPQRDPGVRAARRPARLPCPLACPFARQGVGLATVAAC